MLIEETNLNISSLWLNVLEKIVISSGKEISPLVISLTDFSENEFIRNSLDKKLASDGLASIHSVSETIFPQSLYHACGYDRNKLFDTYKNAIPRIKKAEPRKNAKGIYFERLIAYDESQQINQLEIIINSLTDPSNQRRTKLQASIFDPKKDHINNPYQGFPCLQHVTFFKSENNGLIINSFYALQHLYKKAYGNWLGLINLGNFVAKESGLELEKFNCFIGVEQLEPEISKTDAKKLLEAITNEQK